jgi:membrane protein required for colicin V production
MTAYDLIFFGLLIILGIYGYVTGAVRQIVNLLSFFVSIFIALASRPFLMRMFHLDTVTSWIAAIILLVALFVGMRYLGHALADKLHTQKALGYIDRGLGIAMGVLLTLMIIGAFHLIFSLVTPIDRQPHWFREAKVYPLSVRCAKTIQALIPPSTGGINKMDEESR